MTRLRYRLTRGLFFASVLFGTAIAAGGLR